ncbi:MAG: type I-E CRISPR-associated endoribonuclease Cas2 [Planctomycetes bacterium]|nr:type I-E CRISPR-associated endoribonuclease Cas2 [Planctomycetota bacterium]
MSMTMAVTRNVPGRFRGFLASCMLEAAPGVYVSPRMRKAVRERLWKVMLDWAGALPEDGGVLLIWRDREAPSGLSLRTLGWPQKDITEHEGLWLSIAGLTEKHDLEELEELAAGPEEN